MGKIVFAIGNFNVLEYTYHSDNSKYYIIEKILLFGNTEYMGIEFDKKIAIKKAIIFNKYN